MSISCPPPPQSATVSSSHSTLQLGRRVCVRPGSDRTCHISSLPRWASLSGTSSETRWLYFYQVRAPCCCSPPREPSFQVRAGPGVSDDGREGPISAHRYHGARWERGGSTSSSPQPRWVGFSTHPTHPSSIPAETSLPRGAMISHHRGSRRSAVPTNGACGPSWPRGVRSCSVSSEACSLAAHAVALTRFLRSGLSRVSESGSNRTIENRCTSLLGL